VPRSTSTASWRSASAPRRRPDGQHHPAVALIAAAGSGERLGAGGPKALVELGGRPLIAWSIDAFAAAPSISLVVIAAPQGAEEEIERLAGEAAHDADGLPTATPHTIVVTGGASRAASVGRALAEAPASAEIVAVHDAARPLVTAGLVEALISRLESEPGAAGVIAASALTDTVKRVDGAAIVATESRDRLWTAQTPQVFRAPALREAHDVDPETLAAATDDAMLVERCGGTVLVEPTAAENLKVTTLTDLRLAELLLAERSAHASS
jgi:2-C-methyl-D-erythritol 4-phosphate cytidylyltransferase